MYKGMKFSTSLQTYYNVVAYMHNCTLTLLHYEHEFEYERE